MKYPSGVSGLPGLQRQQPTVMKMDGLCKDNVSCSLFSVFARRFGSPWLMPFPLELAQICDRTLDPSAPGCRRCNSVIIEGVRRNKMSAVLFYSSHLLYE